MVTEELRRAVGELELNPRTAIWRSLSYCVLDAVWSINASYDSVVSPLVRRVAAAHGDDTPTVPPDQHPGEDPLPVGRFLASYSEVDALLAVTNAQRTSTRGGILKADAALRYATILGDYGLSTRADALRLLDEPAAVEEVDRALARVPGDGVRRAYLWMLVGSDDLVKPDRMVLGFLGRYGGPRTPRGAREALVALATELSTPARPVTPWMVDHAIWRAERARR